MQRFGLAAVALVLAAGVWWYATRSDDPVPESPTIDIVEEPTPEAAKPLLQGQEPAPVDDEPEPRQAGGIVLTGVVVDTNDQPVPDVPVLAKSMGKKLREGKTNAKGRYRLEVDGKDPGRNVYGVVVARKDALVGTASFLLFASPTSRFRPEGNERKVHKLVLRPGVPLRVHVSSNCQGGLPATVRVVAMWGGGDPIALEQTDAAGDLTLEGIPLGPWRVVASAEGCGRASAFVQLPRKDEEPVDLTLPEERVLTVTVRDKDSEKPIADAIVTLRERVRTPDGTGSGFLASVPERHTTDASGVVRIAGLGEEEGLDLQAQAEGYPVPSRRFRRRGGPGFAEVKADVTEVTLQLARPLTVRWPIEDDGAGVPPNGTDVLIKPWTNTGRTVVPPKGVIEDGELVVAGWGTDGAYGYAEIADFGIARLRAQAGETVGSPITFYPLRQVSVVATRADGKPATGYFLIVRDGGNNQVAPAVPLDAKGRAVMKGLYGGRSLVNVSLGNSADGSGGRRFPLGSVNLADEDGRFEFTIPEARSIRLRLTIDGAPAPKDLPATPRMGSLPIEFEREADGAFLIQFTPHQANVTVVVTALVTGYRADYKRFELTDADPHEITLALHRTGDANVQVNLPQDKQHHVLLQRWDAKKNWWMGGTALGAMGMRARRADSSGIITFSTLEPARYRAIDQHSGVPSEPFDIVAGEQVQASIDLSKTGLVKGRIEVPDGVPFKGFTVDTDEQLAVPNPHAFGPSRRGNPVHPKGGDFWIRVPGDRPVTIRLHHRSCRPHPTDGHITLTEPREGVVLRAILGYEARVALTKEPPALTRGRSQQIRVRVYKDKVEGKGIELEGTLADASVTFGGYVPGTYTVWIDVPQNAPVILKDVKLTAEDIDLGVAEPKRGSSLRIHVHVKAGQSPPRYAVWLQKLDEPKYTRNVDASGEEITVRGMGPGRFRVTASAYNGAGKPLDEEIGFDGENDVERTLDLR